MTSTSKEYRINQEALDDLARMSRELVDYINQEPNARRANDLREIFEYLGDILSEVERHPV